MWWGVLWSIWWLYVIGILFVSYVGEEVDFLMDFGFVGDWVGN